MLILARKREPERAAFAALGSAEKRSSSGKATAGVGMGVGLGTTLAAGLAWLSSRQGKQPGPLVDRAPKLERKNNSIRGWVVEAVSSTSAFSEDD
jgi:hypothetical protein